MLLCPFPSKESKGVFFLRYLLMVVCIGFICVLAALLRRDPM
jgi:hypothetical protein